jgi:hypothetical protein
MDDAPTPVYSNPQPAPAQVPSQPAKKKMPVWLIVVIVLVVLGLCTCGGCTVLGIMAAQGGSGTSTSSSSSSTGATSGTQTESTPAEATKPTATIGTPFQIGNAEITVSGLEPATTIGPNQYLQKTGEFRILSVSIKNTSKAQFTTDSNLFKLVGSDGAEYSTDSDNLMYLAPEQSLFLEALNPGVTKNGQIIFTVPASAQVVSVRVSGGLGDKAVDVKVQ